MINRKRLLSLIFMFFFSGNSFGEQVKMIAATDTQLSTAGQPVIQEQTLMQPPPMNQYQQKGQMQLPVPVDVKEQLIQPQQPKEEKLSEFERYISERGYKDIKDKDIKGSFPVSARMRQFGYDLFRYLPSSFAPANNVPVGPDYMVGPGDEIKITVWGKVDGKWGVIVDRDGNISLPKVGVLGVAGLAFVELKDLLQKEFSKYYTGFEMNVSMGSLRTIRVYIVGNAEKPGAYTVSSLSTLVTALFEAGGPSKVGTMRDVQVKRSGKTVIHFDMYDFLLKGDKGNDLRLMPEDVIFIPPVGMLAAVAGSVQTPAIYEIKGETKITQLIEMAGGLSGIAFRGRVQIERILDNSKHTVFESNLDDIRDKEITLQSGDLVKIYQVVEDRRIVKLYGAVQREGEYGFKPGMTVKDLISMGGLKYYSSNQAELARVKVSETGPQTARLVIDLSKAMEGDAQHNLTLEMNDYLLVRSVPEWQLYKTVDISGEVRFPGTYTIKKGERLSALIERAGGFTDKGYLQGAVFTRRSVRELQQKNLDESIDRLEQQMFSQAAISAQTAFSAEDVQQQRAVAEQQKAIIAKMKAAKAQGRMVIKLDAVDRFKGSVYDIELEDGDSLVIPEQPNSIQVMGSIYNSTAFVYEPNITISTLIDKAGGMTRYADDKDIFVLKIDGSAVSKRQSGMFFMSSKLDPGDTVIVPEKIERIAWMREIKDLTQILYQIAVSAAVVIKLF